jgi:hypothetical protein
VRTFKSNPLSLLLVVALLGIIVIVLILPDVDLPDTAFQRNSSLQVLRALSQQVSHASVNAGPFRISFQFGNTSTIPRQVREIRVRHSGGLPIQYEALRC